MGAMPAETSSATHQQAMDDGAQVLSPMAWLPGVEKNNPECPGTQPHLSPTGSLLQDDFNRTPEFNLSDRELG